MRIQTAPPQLVTTENDEEEIQAVGKGGIDCYRCGGQGHIAAKCKMRDARAAEVERKNEDPRVMTKAREKETEKER